MGRKIIVFVASVTFAMLVTVFSSPVMNVSSNSNHYGVNASQGQASTFQEASNIEAMVQYTVQIGNGNNLSYYDVNSSITLSGFSGESVNVHSTMSGGSQTYTLNESFSLSDFVSFENTNSYYNESSIPDPNGTGIFTTYIYSSAKDNLVNSISMLTIDNSYNFSRSLTIFMIKESGFNQLFRNTNYNTSMAYLFIPYLLQPSVNTNVNANIVYHPMMASPSPEIIKIPGGGGFTSFSSGTLHEYDNTVAGIHLWDVSNDLTLVWSSLGGSLSSWVANPSYSIDSKWDWSYVSQEKSHSSSTNYFEYDYQVTLYSDFPLYPFLQWLSYPTIDIKEYNNGTCHVEIVNLVLAWDSNIIAWIPYSYHVLYDSYVSNGAATSVTQYIVNSVG